MHYLGLKAPGTAIRLIACAKRRIVIEGVRTHRARTSEEVMHVTGVCKLATYIIVGGDDVGQSGTSVRLEEHESELGD